MKAHHVVILVFTTHCGSAFTEASHENSSPEAGVESGLSDWGGDGGPLLYGHDSPDGERASQSDAGAEASQDAASDIAATDAHSPNASDAPSSDTGGVAPTLCCHTQGNANNVYCLSQTLTCDDSWTCSTQSADDGGPIVSCNCALGAGCRMVGSEFTHIPCTGTVEACP